MTEFKTKVRNGHTHVYVVGENFTNPGGLDGHVHEILEDQTGPALNERSLMRTNEHRHAL